MSNRQTTQLVVAMIALGAILLVIGGLHIRAVMVGEAGRAAVAELLDLPLTQVRPSHAPVFSPPRYMDVLSEDGKQQIASAIVHGRHPFGLSFPVASPLQRWSSEHTLGPDEAAQIVRNVESELLDGPPSDIHTLDEVVAPDGASKGWTAEIHV